jgi:hypothetical protein
MPAALCDTTTRHGQFASTRWTVVLAAGPSADAEAVPYDELSARVRRPAATLRKDAERLRASYGKILREEVCGTVTDPAEVDEELRYLCQALTSG